MHHLVEWVRGHPYWSAGLGIGLVVLIYLWWRSGSSAPAQGGASNLGSYYAAAANNANATAGLQAAEAQYQAQSYAVQQAASAQNAATQAAVQIAQSNNQTQLQEVQALAPVQEQANSLQALVANKQTEAQNYASFIAPIINAENQGYNLRSVSNNLINALPPPPGANPGNYPSTGGMYTPGQAAHILNTLPPGLAHLYITGAPL